MSIVYKNSDFVLTTDDYTTETMSVVYKYDSFLEALTTPDFEHVREAIRKSIHFLVSGRYADTQQIAAYNYGINPKLKEKYESLRVYLEHFRIRDRKSYSIDLATGTGKSWVIYGVAQIMLSEGFVDKVLVLCPSLTIEEELKKKFEKLSGDVLLTNILKELGAICVSPSIKNANVPILNGDICVENIHAAYERTGSSIEDSFKGKGSRVLVISDEAHHIYSPIDSGVKKWFHFLTDSKYDFRYLLGLSGTPYIKDEYFHDVVFRYSLKQAMEDGIIKKIDYKVQEESSTDKGFDETYHNHIENQEKYSGILKPITIIVTDKIVRCIQVYNELVEYIAKKESTTYEQAARKAIWVTSGIPSNTNEKAIIENILDQPEKTRKGNLIVLKTVDEPDNPVEWIVSVSMLTEGWDVKNVFQIVPHEQRAFNSKLLISQVLGRGLRIPSALKDPVYVKINNHEKWTQEIVDLYNEVLEIENRLSWRYDKSREMFVFPLYNLSYSSIQDTVEIKQKPAGEPESVTFSPQSRSRFETSIYSESGTSTFTVETKGAMEIEQAAREIKLFLKDKDEAFSKRWPIKRIETFLIENLEKDGYDSSFITRDNLSKVKEAFGPMARATGKESPRMKMKPDLLEHVFMDEMSPQYFSEHALKNHGRLFYHSGSLESLPQEENLLLSGFLEDKNNYDQIKASVEKYGGRETEIKFLQDNLIPQSEDMFKSPLNMIYVSYEPEYRFAFSVFNNIDLFDSFIKSPDKGFYSIPYSYKPEQRASTHVHRDNFNPDFFLKLKSHNTILVVEIKAEADSRPKNKAKFRDGKEHFLALNQKLEEKDKGWRYFFYFLSPEDIPEFFQAVREGRYHNWKSSLMHGLV